MLCTSCAYALYVILLLLNTLLLVSMETSLNVVIWALQSTCVLAIHVVFAIALDSLLT